MKASASGDGKQMDGVAATAAGGGVPFGDVGRR